MKSFLVIVLLALSVNIMAQDSTAVKKGKIGLWVTTFGVNDIILHESLEGAPSYDGDKFLSMGVQYLHPFNKWLDFRTGLNYSKHQITITPMEIPGYIPGVDYMFMGPYNENISIISIPVGVQVNVLKYFFINGGFSLDIDVSGSNSFEDQTGFGLDLGAGAQYEFKGKYTVFINPYSQSHSMLVFSSQNNRQWLMQAGMRLGVMIRL